MGAGLLTMLSELDPDTENLQKIFGNERGSPEEELRQVSHWLSSYKHNLDESEVDWEGMKVFLVGKRNFLLRLLENGNLLEHESFTDMLWAVFHQVNLSRVLDYWRRAHLLYLLAALAVSFLSNCFPYSKAEKRR